MMKLFSKVKTSPSCLPHDYCAEMQEVLEENKERTRSAVKCVLLRLGKASVPNQGSPHPELIEECNL